MNDLVSICIPAYNRPSLLFKALASCVLQSYDSLEILVGDDSPDESSAEVIEGFRSRRDWSFTYYHNDPPLGQRMNVAHLFERARGDRIVLLHDDDVLLPNAVSDLAAPWSAHSDLAVAFGKQEVISETGAVEYEMMKRAEAMYGKVGDEGLLPISLRPIFLHQVPNDGYMISASIAREIGYSSGAPSDKPGFYCDFDFLLRLGAALGPNRIYFVDRTVSQYRLTRISVTNAARTRKLEHAAATIALVKRITSMEIPRSLEPERATALWRLGDSLVKAYALTGQRRRALQHFMSSTYGWRRRMSAKGLYHLALIVDARFDGLRAKLDSRLGIDFSTRA
jgi:glycosyltransferase involved in cell wall biosynthesis